jgi:hypothetical protein
MAASPLTGLTLGPPKYRTGSSLPAAASPGVRPTGRSGPAPPGNKAELHRAVPPCTG